MLALVLGLSFGALAQVDRSFETYVGYQVVRVNPDVVTPTFKFVDSTDTHGFNVSETYYANKVVGVTAELGANFDTEGKKASLVTAMGGLTFKANRAGKIQPFVRALAGTSYIKADSAIFTQPTKADFGFAASLGGGLDWRINKKFGIRLFQVDYLSTSNFGQHQNNVRVGGGILF